MKAIFHFIRQIQIWFVLLRADLQLWYAIYKAEQIHQENKVRYYVIPDYNHRLIICSRADIRRYKKAGCFDYSAKMDDFKDECFYYTPHGEGQGKIPGWEKEIKRKMWLNYVLQVKRLI